MHRLPARARLTLGFAGAMAALLAVLGTAVYLAVAAALLDELDTGLRTRAAALRADLTASGVELGTAPGGLVEPTEAFAQILDRHGGVLDSSLDPAAPVLPAAVVAGITEPRLFDADVPGVTGGARILAVPVQQGGTDVVAVVGASLSDRDDALALVTLCLAVGGPAALATASVAGWIVAGRALRPVERMRQQASAISASGLDRRLTVPVADDELHRLAVTLNAMLVRLEQAQHAEHRFLDNASHELRTPLTVLRAELDIALSRPRPPVELVAALCSAHEETARLSRLDAGLLVLSRAPNGPLPILGTAIPLGAPLHAAAQYVRTRADARQVRIVVHADAVQVPIDAPRVRQAVDNLLDNALRFAPDGSTITLRGDVHVDPQGDTVHITVHDTGSGFPSDLADRAFDPFQRAAGSPAHARTTGTGLGLSIVRAVAEGHGGSVGIDPDVPSGTRVRMRLPAHSLEPARTALADRTGTA